MRVQIEYVFLGDIGKVSPQTLRDARNRAARHRAGAAPADPFAALRPRPPAPASPLLEAPSAGMRAPPTAGGPRIGAGAPEVDWLAGMEEGDESGDPSAAPPTPCPFNILQVATRVRPTRAAPGLCGRVRYIEPSERGVAAQSSPAAQACM